LRLRLQAQALVSDERLLRALPRRRLLKQVPL